MLNNAVVSYRCSSALPCCTQRQANQTADSSRQPQKAMFMDTNEQSIGKLSINALPKLAMMICMAGVIVIGFIPPVYDYIYSLSFGL